MTSSNKQRLSQEQLDQFQEEGYIITEPVFTEKELKDISNEFKKLFKVNLETANKTKDPLKIEIANLRPFVGQTHLLSEVLLKTCQHPIYQEACLKLLSPNADLYYNQAVIKPPGVGRPFAWHQDNGYAFTDPEFYITCWTAISEATIENGCIWIIPGSHKGGLQSHKRLTTEEWALEADESKAIPVEVKPGQVVIFHSLLFHKSGANTSDQIRESFVPQYHVAGVKGKEGELIGDQVPLLREGVFQNISFEMVQV
ncbi:MAG: hypothetical protein COA79_09530 [Planctomycetota bacterium]|nr:MAG: hypothetical protein COA79_09530 [Planctomycetota bacterium]